MKRFAAAATLSLLTVLVAGCNFHLGSSSHAAPKHTVTITVTAPPTSTPTSVPTQAPTQVPTSTAPPISSLANFTVCIAPVMTCQGELKSQPATILLSGDGSLFVADVAWTGWGSEGATGHGTLKIDNCVPNCAQGGFKDYEATIVVDDLTPYGGGKQAYDTMNVDAPGTPFGSHTYHHLAP